MSSLIKNILRKTYGAAREQLSESFQKKASLQVCSIIQNLDQYRYAKRIALYSAQRGEVDLGALWKSAPLQGKYCYFPVLTNNKHLAFLPATPATPFKKNKYGILEPDVDPQLAIAAHELQLIFVPLVVFDKRCNRIGMGSGYYDRSLASAPGTCLLGVAYEFQRHIWIPEQAWDVRLTAVATEKTVYWRDELQ